MTPIASPAAPAAPVLSSVTARQQLDDAERDLRIAVSEKTEHDKRAPAALVHSDANAQTHDEASTLLGRKVRQAEARVTVARGRLAEAQRRERAAQCVQHVEQARTKRDRVALLRAERDTHAQAIGKIDEEIRQHEFDIAQHESFVAFNDVRPEGTL